MFIIFHSYPVFGRAVVPQLYFVTHGSLEKSIGPRVFINEQIEIFLLLMPGKEMWLQVQAICTQPVSCRQSQSMTVSSNRVLAPNLIWCLLRGVETHSAVTNPRESLSLE